MKITKTVAITIEVGDDECNHHHCSSGCKFNCDGDVCAQYDVMINILRCPRCIAEFGMGEKE